MARLLAELRGDVVLRVEVLELLVVVGPALEVVDVAGQLLGAAPRCRGRSAERRAGSERRGAEPARYTTRIASTLGIGPSPARPARSARRRGRGRGSGRPRRRPTAASSGCAGSRSRRGHATPAQNSATSTTLATARASIWSARIAGEASEHARTQQFFAPAVSLRYSAGDFDDAPARQPRASPSPPPSGGIALGGARAAREQVIEVT